jgi:hypothetical protein
VARTASLAALEQCDEEQANNDQRDPDGMAQPDRYSTEEGRDRSGAESEVGRRDVPMSGAAGVSLLCVCDLDVSVPLRSRDCLSRLVDPDCENTP